MSSKYRIIDDGLLLTVGEVVYDLNGQPATVKLNVLEASSLIELISVVDQIRVGLKEPVLVLAEIGCALS